MAITLYDATVPSFLQVLGATRGVLDKGMAYAREAGVDLQEVVKTPLCGDMLPFDFQVIQVAHHSLGALKGAQAGAFSPRGANGEDYAALKALVVEAEAELKTWTPEAVNALEGRDVMFSFGDFRMPFVAEDFLLSFSLPNFYFHATTAYDILRMKGAPLGKRDFMGQVRLKVA